jgi:hypothetical protein
MLALTDQMRTEPVRGTVVVEVKYESLCCIHQIKKVELNVIIFKKRIPKIHIS